MPKYLIYYGIRENDSSWNSHHYATVTANNPTHAIQLAATWIPGIQEIDVRGTINREIGNN